VNAGQKFDKLVEIIKRLRAECPWDRQQDHASLRQYLLEETYEVLEALDAGDQCALRAELGDLLLQIVLHAQIAAENERFDIADVLQAIGEKLVRRHPHVFDGVAAGTPKDVVARWERLKCAEQEGRSRLEGVPQQLPALLKAARVTEKMLSAGVQPSGNPDVADQARRALASLLDSCCDSDVQRVEEHLAELLVAVTQLAASRGVNAEDALRTKLDGMIAEFRRREDAGRGETIPGRS